MTTINYADIDARRAAAAEAERPVVATRCAAVKEAIADAYVRELIVRLRWQATGDIEPEHALMRAAADELEKLLGDRP